MSSSAVALKPSTISVSVESGPLKGQSFSFQRDRITIGRDAENHLVIPEDSKMSRKHAELVFENDTLVVKNLSQKNPLWVDNQEVKTQIVQGAQKIQVGETIFRVRIEGGRPTAIVPPLAPARKLAAAALPLSHEFSQPKSAVLPKTPPMDSKKMNFYIIVGIVIVGLIWLLTSGSKLGRKASTLRTRDQVLLDLEKSESAMRDLEKKQEDTGQQTLQYKTAQEHYIKGFRDYRQGQFARAMSSFQAALSFYPQHDLAKKYLMLSRRKFDELVQFNMIQGKRYKGKNNYRLCKSAYANVMIMLKDPNDTIYKEAKQYYNECSLLFEGKY